LSTTFLKNDVCHAKQGVVEDIDEEVISKESDDSDNKIAQVLKKMFSNFNSICVCIPLNNIFLLQIMQDDQDQVIEIEKI
jgi:hypothetical protein